MIRNANPPAPPPEVPLMYERGECSKAKGHSCFSALPTPPPSLSSSSLATTRPPLVARSCRRYFCCSRASPRPLPHLQPTRPSLPSTLPLRAGWLSPGLGRQLMLKS